MVNVTRFGFLCADPLSDGRIFFYFKVVYNFKKLYIYIILKNQKITIMFEIKKTFHFNMNQKDSARLLMGHIEQHLFDLYGRDVLEECPFLLSQPRWQELCESESDVFKASTSTFKVQKSNLGMLSYFVKNYSVNVKVEVTSTWCLITHIHKWRNSDGIGFNSAQFVEVVRF